MERLGGRFDSPTVRERPNNQKNKNKNGSKIALKTNKIDSKSTKNKTKNSLKNQRKTIKIKPRKQTNKFIKSLDNITNR